jgi:hypothetical protein
MSASSCKTGRTRPLGSPPVRYAPGRVCLHPDCTQQLNPYNGGICCYQHDGWKPERVRVRVRTTTTNVLVDVTAAREHVLALFAAGTDLWMIELKTQVPSKTIRDIRDGRHAKIRKETAAALLAMAVRR